VGPFPSTGSAHSSPDGGSVMPCIAAPPPSTRGGMIALCRLDSDPFQGPSSIRLSLPCRIDLPVITSRSGLGRLPSHSSAASYVENDNRLCHAHLSSLSSEGPGPFYGLRLCSILSSVSVRDGPSYLSPTTVESGWTIIRSSSRVARP
jgi:hypothetical protein